MGIKATEVGKVVRLAAGFDMSSATSTTITVTDPDGVEATVPDSRITISVSGFTDPDLGAISGNEYAQFSTSATDFTQAGSYSLYITHNDTTNGYIYYSDAATLTITAKGS